MLFVNAQWTKSSRYTLNKKISPHHVEQAPDIHNIKGHAPRERVSWNLVLAVMNPVMVCHAPRERVSWNFRIDKCTGFNYCHAPRERVSWNLSSWQVNCKWLVTLHVSVWVEIQFHFKIIKNSWVTLHVSVWVEMELTRVKRYISKVTLHVSVWVEIFFEISQSHTPSHAPRERVSWNVISVHFDNLNVLVTLHVSVWVEMLKNVWFTNQLMSRSTWACELKWFLRRKSYGPIRHAPRERVSWNDF